MKRLYEFITKANQVLLFFAAIALIVFIGYLIVEDMNSGAGPQVSIVASTAEPAATPVRDVRFLGKDGNFFILGIVKLSVGGKGSESPALGGKRKMQLYSSAGEDSGQIVNVIYSNGAQIAKTLLPTDGLVLRHSLPFSYDEKTPFPAHLYTYVIEDTNGDKVLDEKDRQDIVIVDPALKRPDITIKDCVDYDLLWPDSMVVKVRTKENLRFIEVNARTGEQTEINWK